MTVLAHANDSTECDGCEQPVGTSRALRGRHVVCDRCSTGAPPISATTGSATTFQERVAEAMERQHGSTPTEGQEATDDSAQQELRERIADAMERDGGAYSIARAGGS